MSGSCARKTRSWTYYEDLVADPKKTIQQIYHQLELGDFASVSAALDEKLVGHKEYRPNQVMGYAPITLSDTATLDISLFLAICPTIFPTGVICRVEPLWLRVSAAPLYGGDRSQFAIFVGSERFLKLCCHKASGRLYRWQNGNEPR
ncbi:MAG: hypothetical protein U0930_17200 [Pirellulales bacterium]